MEGIGVAANIISVIDLSLKVVTLCVQYSKEVSGARDDIERLSSQVQHLAGVLRATRRVVEDTPVALVSQELMVSFRSCITDLQVVEGKLNPSPIRTGMRRFGLRALKWPFKKKEIDQLLAGLERHEKAIMLGLQVDQTAILIDIQERVKDMSLKPIDEPSSYQQRHLAVPFTNDPDFVPRPTIETWMHQRYTQPSQKMALVGMGGFGKSKLAIQFAHRIYADEDDTSVFWVHAGSKTAFEESYRALADLMSLPRRPEPDTNVLLLVRDWLQRQNIPPWLLIIDNADEIDLFFPPNLNDGIASYIPKSNKGKVLITSRSLDVAERLVGSSKAIMRVPVMAEEQALHLLQSTLENTTDEVSARAIVHALDFIPLAVKQAAGYINRRSPQVTPKSYLDEFHESERKRDRLLRSDKGDLDRNDGVSSSVIVTWQITFDKIKEEHPSAANLLSLMSQFQAQDIPDFMLHDYDDDHTTDRSNHHNKDISSDRPSFEDDLDVLRGYSLVHVATGGLFEMHSLVQFCTRQWIKKSENPTRWRELFMKLAADYFPGGELSNWPVCRRLLSHIIPHLETRPQNYLMMHAWIRLINHYSYFLMQNGEYRLSESLTEVVVQECARAYGPNHRFTLWSKGYLASFLMMQERWDEAGQIYAEVVEFSGNKLGFDHPRTLSWMSDYAEILKFQGHLNYAEALSRVILEHNRVVLGANHRTTLHNAGRLASVLVDQGRLVEGETMVRDVLEEHREILGNKHPRTLNNASILASILWRKGSLKEAEALCMEVLTRQKVIRFPNHPDILRSMSNLAVVWMSQGRFEEAEILQVELLQKLKEKYGVGHRSTLTCMWDLAISRRCQGQRHDALMLMQECVDLRRKEIGPNDPATRGAVDELQRWKDEDLGARTSNSKSTDSEET